MQPVPRGPVCQSCGLPMSVGGGTEMDGVSRSIEYCSQCYRDGRFTDPAITVEEMVLRSQERMRSAGVPEPVIEKNLMKIYSLDRWMD